MSEQVKQIAQRIRALREISERSVAQAASDTGVSHEEYVAYESGAIDIPISFLLAFSHAYGVDTTEILTGERPRLSVCALTRKNMGIEVARASHYNYKNLAYNFTGRKVEPLYVTVEPDANPTLVTNSHSGHEFDYVLEGTLRLKVGNHDMILSPGDSAYYDSIHPHAMQAVGDTRCRFLAIVIP